MWFWFYLLILKKQEISLEESSEKEKTRLLRVWLKVCFVSTEHKDGLHGFTAKAQGDFQVALSVRLNFLEM